jgi:hypothetical protein
MNFEQHLVEEVKKLRSRLASENISSLRLDIEIEGRVHDGELLVTFKLGEMYSGGNASGDSLEAVLGEFLRRKRWSERHESLKISYTGGDHE